LATARASLILANYNFPLIAALALQEQGRIPLNQDETVSVNFYRSGENILMLCPWLNDSPALGMLGTLDPEGGSLDIALCEKENSFCLNLYFDLSDGSYRRVEPSIIRYETEGFLEPYYYFVEPLKSYEKY